MIYHGMDKLIPTLMTCLSQLSPQIWPPAHPDFAGKCILGGAEALHLLSKLPDQHCSCYLSSASSLQCIRRAWMDPYYIQTAALGNSNMNSYYSNYMKLYIQ